MLEENKKDFVTLNFEGLKKEAPKVAEAETVPTVTEEFFNNLNHRVTRYSDGTVKVADQPTFFDSPSTTPRPEHYPDLFVKDEAGNFKKNDIGEYIRK